MEEIGVKIMAQNGQTKVCPSCAETIKAAAKVCPFCRSRQGRFGVLKGELAGGFIVIVLLGGLIFVWSRVIPGDSDSTSGSDVISHRNELPVVHTTLEPVGMSEQFWLSGFVTNQSNRPWRVLGLEVRFLDARDQLLDVRHSEFSKSDAFVVQPRREHAFRIRLYGVSSSITGSVRNVQVESAVDGRKYYNPN